MIEVLPPCRQPVVLPDLPHDHLSRFVSRVYELILLFLRNHRNRIRMQLHLIVDLISLCERDQLSQPIPAHDKKLSPIEHNQRVVLQHRSAVPYIKRLPLRFLQIENLLLLQPALERRVVWARLINQVIPLQKFGLSLLAQAKQPHLREPDYLYNRPIRGLLNVHNFAHRIGEPLFVGGPIHLQLRV